MNTGVNTTIAMTKELLSKADSGFWADYTFFLVSNWSNLEQKYRKSLRKLEIWDILEKK
jgi:hypothetical protein